MVRMGRYREHEPNLYETPPKWMEEQLPPQDHGSRSDSNNKVGEEPHNPQFDHTYLAWQDGVRPNPLILCEMEQLTEDTKRQVEEEEEEEGDGDDEEEEDVWVEEPKQHGKKGGWDVLFGILIIDTQQQLDNELSNYISLCTYKLDSIQK